MNFPRSRNSIWRAQARCCQGCPLVTMLHKIKLLPHWFPPHLEVRSAWDLGKSVFIILTACCCHSYNLLWNEENSANQACQSHILLCSPFAPRVYVHVRFPW